MSHSWTHKGVTFIGNSDLSGEITIVTPTGRFDVSGDALVEFVASRLVDRKIYQMESEKDPLVVLGVKP